MKKITQALIMAGGVGARMSESINPFHSKPLIEYAEQSMLGHLLDNLYKTGIKNFLIATNQNSYNAIFSIVSNKKIPNIAVVVADGKTVAGRPEYGAVPYEIKDFLKDRFLMVCGHHPVSILHIRKMLDSAKIYKNVFTAYPNNLYTMDKTKRVIYNNGNFRFVNLEKDIISNKHFYVRNPYILQKEFIESTSIYIDDYRETFSFYIFKEWDEKKKISRRSHS